MRLGLCLDPDDAINLSLWLPSKLPGRRSAFEARRYTPTWCSARPDPRPVRRSRSEFVGTSSRAPLLGARAEAGLSHLPASGR